MDREVFGGNPCEPPCSGTARLQLSRSVDRRYAVPPRYATQLLDAQFSQRRRNAFGIRMTCDRLLNEPSAQTGCAINFRGSSHSANQGSANLVTKSASSSPHLSYVLRVSALKRSMIDVAILASHIAKSTNFVAKKSFFSCAWPCLGFSCWPYVDLNPALVDISAVGVRSEMAGVRQDRRLLTLRTQ